MLFALTVDDANHRHKLQHTKNIHVLMISSKKICLITQRYVGDSFMLGCKILIHHDEVWSD